MPFYLKIEITKVGGITLYAALSWGWLSTVV